MERDYAVGHPAASDYDGSEYNPTTAPFGQDYAPNHPARGGKNITELDTPDGTHARTVKEWHDNAARMAQRQQPEAQPQTGGLHADTVNNSTTITIDGKVQTT